MTVLPRFLATPKGGGPETPLGGDGRLIVGIVGRENGQRCIALGLLRKQ